MSVDSAQEAYDNACQDVEEATQHVEAAEAEYQQSLESLRQAENNLSEGRDILTTFRILEDNYRADYALTHDPGEESLMRFLIKYDVKEAIDHLQKILDAVTAYCDCPMTLDRVWSSQSCDYRDNYDRPTEEEIRFRKKQAMDDASYRLRKERPDNMPNPNTLVRCPKCGRPFYLCRCEKPKDFSD